MPFVKKTSVLHSLPAIRLSLVCILLLPYESSHYYFLLYHLITFFNLQRFHIIPIDFTANLRLKMSSKSCPIKNFSPIIFLMILVPSNYSLCLKSGQSAAWVTVHRLLGLVFDHLFNVLTKLYMLLCGQLFMISG